MPRKRCVHGKTRFCRVCHPQEFCPHGRNKHICKECGGRGICEHNRQRSNCTLCATSPGICEHKRTRNSCGLCDGAGVFRRHKRNAAERNLTNELTEQRYRWLIAGRCHYCGAPAGGVDRVKSEYGYTVLNSVPACATCNFAKQSLSAPDFLAHIYKIVSQTSSYEKFKTRWHETRTTGPDLGGLNGSTTDNSVSRTPQPESRTQ